MWNFTFDRENDQHPINLTLPGLDNIEFSRSKAGQFRPFHVHSECHILFCIAGKGFLKLGDQEISLLPGTLALIRPGIPHSCGSTEGWFEFWGVSFYSSGEADTITRDFLDSETYLADFSKYMDYVRGAFSFLHDLCGSSVTNRTSVPDIRTQFYSLLFFSRKMLLDHPIPRELPGVLPLQDMMLWISEHYREDLSLEILSKKFSISASHLSRLFYQSFGISPINYLIDVRLNKAKDLLIFSDLPAGEIAEQVGYTNVYHFSNLFRKRIGLTPQEFRILCRNNEPDSWPE